MRPYDWVYQANRGIIYRSINSFYLPPHQKIVGILFNSLSVCLSICLSAWTSDENLTFSSYS